ncbi:(2Fe-2S)-binding protein [Rhodovarius crocodyli]|uniref:(2Fe-2S)-binding protein n=1 Tax=Rhodovarius crocodyli TaxID=1979269 RepID=A0A437M3P0_9PROT|nr:(2Fe-2S)-binding protein [Rhodovarius crocodyli]RVT92308.1 (2Fe-2S)-binding protein [Rhodovarius crocodyli]
MSEPKVTVCCTVNGQKVEADVVPRMSLADMLREELHLTGTHLGCEHGVCGACTIIVNGAPVRSCLMFGIQAEGAEIRTVEGLADGDTLSPLQRAFWEKHGLQCGFCTPGFLMLATWMLEQPEPVTEERLRHVLSSNLCRCTGYTNIVRAVTAAAKEMGKWAESAAA